MRLVRLLAPSVLLLPLATSVLRAQALDSLPAGARVRVERAGGGARLHGTLVRADSGRLLVLYERAADTAVVALDHHARVDAYAGERTAAQAFGRGAKVGALVGLGVGGVATGVALAYDVRHRGEIFIPASLVIGVASVAFTVGTTVLGGAIGLADRERWVRVWPER